MSISYIVYQLFTNLATTILSHIEPVLITWIKLVLRSECINYANRTSIDIVSDQNKKKNVPKKRKKDRFNLIKYRGYRNVSEAVSVSLAERIHMLRFIKNKFIKYSMVLFSFNNMCQSFIQNEDNSFNLKIPTHPQHLKINIKGRNIDIYNGKSYFFLNDGGRTPYEEAIFAR